MSQGVQWRLRCNAGNQLSDITLPRTIFKRSLENARNVVALPQKEAATRPKRRCNVQKFDNSENVSRNGNGSDPPASDDTLTKTKNLVEEGFKTVSEQKTDCARGDTQVINGNAVKEPYSTCLSGRDSKQSIAAFVRVADNSACNTRDMGVDNTHNNYWVGHSFEHQARKVDLLFHGDYIQGNRRLSEERRARIVGWLCHLCSQLSSRPSVIYAVSCSLFDRFLAAVRTEDKNKKYSLLVGLELDPQVDRRIILHFVVLAAFRLALKYEEFEVAELPEVLVCWRSIIRDTIEDQLWNDIADTTEAKELIGWHIVTLELRMVSLFSCNVGVPTASSLAHQLVLGDSSGRKNVERFAEMEILLQMALVDRHIGLSFHPSVQAAAAVSIYRLSEFKGKLATGNNQDDLKCVEAFHKYLDRNDVKECRRRMLERYASFTGRSLPHLSPFAQWIQLERRGKKQFPILKGLLHRS